ncbi:hypothetical protein FQR65_LT11834 [Abscondita terminalis]|nr:hypothetical protein FQR65_LT11834 [Abscondita terminalis]
MSKCGYCEVALNEENFIEHECLKDKGNLVLDANNTFWLEEDTDRNNPEVVENTSQEHYEPITEEQRVAEWTSAAINLLIEKFRTYKLQLEKKNSIKKHIWKKIANEMQEFEYTYTWDQLQNKWKSMLRTYKSIKDHNNQSGRNRKNWDYFNKMDELLYGHPAIDPPILIHNGIQIKKIDDESTSKSETVSTPESSRASTPDKPRKRKAPTDISDMLTSLMQQNEKQHEENLKEKRRFNDLLETLIDSFKK